MSAMDTLAAEKAAIPNADAESAADCNPASEKTFLTSPVFHIPIKLIARAEPQESRLPQYRTEFMRDRDRIMYATAFRRLSGKTQIYTVGSDDHKKNRLTHTLEVSQIARTIASALGFDTNLTEAIALAHDFGHTPFGHAGEQILHEIMIPGSRYVRGSPFYKKTSAEIAKAFEREALTPDQKGSISHLFGFKHNLQSVRVCALLEDSYRTSAKNAGLNLTNFTLCGIMMHSRIRYNDVDPYPDYQKYFTENMSFPGNRGLAWSFEAYIVRCADDIAQWHHDLEDAVREGVLSMKEIRQKVSDALGPALASENRDLLNSITNDDRNNRSNFAKLSHVVVHTLVEDLIEASAQNFKILSDALHKKHPDISAEDLFLTYDQLDLPLKKEEVIGYSKVANTDIFKNTIRECIHHSRNVERMNEKGRYVLRKLFEAYYSHPQQLPDGPIQHIVSTYKDPNAAKGPNIDKPAAHQAEDSAGPNTASEASIGSIRVAFEKMMENPNIYLQSLLMRRICDHIASMTDRYAIDEYTNLYG